jgi:hypothetical protein
MKIKKLYFSIAILAGSMLIEAQTVETMGTCASYIQYYPGNSLQADSVYLINRTKEDITVDALPESAWSAAYPRVISKIQQEPNNLYGILNLDSYPQTEEYGHATFRALWTENGVYMYLTVKDNMIRYNNPGNAWMNDAIEFYFAKAPGEAYKQLIIPAMVGETNAALYPPALEFESGFAHGSQEEYAIFGVDANNWDESTFYWAIRKTAVGFDMEVYMDKDIVTNGNSTTHFGLGLTYSGDVAYDIAGNSLDREGALNMLGNSIRQFSSSANYGYFKMVEEINGVTSPRVAKFDAIYNASIHMLTIASGVSVATIEVYTMTGQLISTVHNTTSVSTTGFNKGSYLVKVVDIAGNDLGVRKLVVY